MRRGHQGFEGWRNENSRNFRQRNFGNPPYRSQRNINQHNSRFASLSPRSLRPHFNSYIANNEQITENYEWAGVRYNQDLQFSYSRTKDQISYPKQIKPEDNYRDSTHNSEGYPINNMGDVDHRQIFLNRKHPIPPWNSDIDERTYINTYKENPHHYNKQHPNYAGHRPPASDHYGGNPIPTNEKSKTFSRSVDDTVNIVRRRLLNREETPQAPCNKGIKDSVNMYDNLKVPLSSSQYDLNFIKKKAPRARKVNCERIKNKIFNQLFKMDKEKIHKLLDNPSSSTKFEYALNSLLTESQNSFNQHMRSVAEKSLCSSSKEFMHNDNNTIYEDTFLKQMQCILDPQDTVLLEDIKPVVMAELSNLLQFDEIDNRCSYDNQDNFSYHNEKRREEENPQDFHDYPSSNNIYSNNSETNNYYENFSSNCSNINNCDAFEDAKPLFERRVQRKSATSSPTTDIGHNSRPDNNDTKWKNTWDDGDYKEIDNYPNDEQSKKFEHNEPVFDANAEFTEDEDTFAELDRQYHVVVDHDFIEDDELSNPIQEVHKTQQESKVNSSIDSLKIKDEMNILKLSDKNEKEIVSQLQDFASNKLESFIDQDTEVRNDSTSYGQNSKTILVVKKEAQENQSNDMEIKNKNEFIYSEISIPSSNSRKRSTDQRPSHRKEKRKKLEDRDSKNKSQEKMLSYKRTVMSSTSSNNYETIISDDLKNCIEPIQSKEKSSHSDNKKQTSCDKNNSEKYIKEKELIKAKPCENRKRQNSTSSNHSISPRNLSAQPSASTKADSKCSLKSIDMFTEMPKKINTHQAFRNTALSKTPKKKDILNQKSNKYLELSDVAKRLSKETQTDKHSVISRFCQTGKINCVTRAIQVNLQPNNENKKTKATDALERMRQIDLEIQELLQEKFKLYSSLEKKEGTSYIPMQNLGMTVLNVNSFEDNIEGNENDDMGDTIVNNFTNIPVEELEQIARETEEIYSISPTRSGRRQKRNISSNLQFKDNPYERKNKKSNTLNFSLIEQIITDDRPLEDIVSLDDLETTPNKLKKKQRRIRKTSKNTANTKKNNSPIPDSIHLKQCYVLLLREDLNKYINGNKLIIKEKCCESNIQVSSVNQHVEETEVHIIPTVDLVDDGSNLSEEVEETVISSDIQFDMLDVSEDIVIGEIFEEKVTGDKLVPICEEIILDNSQSSIEEVTTSAETQGGECKLYDYLADENLEQDSLVASGNADAILAIEGIGPNFLAAGLDGNVYYFNSDGQLISMLRGSNLAVTCLCIVKEKNGTTVYTGSLDSRIRNYDLETGLEKGPECNVLSPIQTMDRAWDTVFVGTKTGFVLQFECKNNLLIPVSTVKFSDQSILALRAMKEGPRKVLLVAARSENVTIKDAQTGLLLRTLNGPKMTVYTLLYEDGKVYCGTSSHQIHVFDYTSGSHVGTHEGGKGAICLRAAGGLLFAGCYDGCVYVYREGEPRPFAQLRGPSLMLLCLSIVGTKIIAGFKDRSLYIWKIPLSILQEMIL